MIIVGADVNTAIRRRERNADAHGIGPMGNYEPMIEVKHC
jgi:Zn-dependent protease with chaperone function